MKKNEFKKTNYFFISYPEKSKGYRFYYHNYSTRIIEFGNAKFIENGESAGPRKVEIEEVRVQIPLPLAPSKIVVATIIE